MSTDIIDHESDDYKHAMFHHSTALERIEQGRLREALTELYGALKLRRKIFASQPNHKYIAGTLMLLADVYLHLKEYDKASKFCFKAQKMQDEANGEYAFERIKSIMNEVIDAKKIGFNGSQKVRPRLHSPVDFLCGSMLIVCISYLVYVIYDYLIL